MLKSGCRVEWLQLQKLQPLGNALVLHRNIHWRVPFLTIPARGCRPMPCYTVLADEEWQAIKFVTQCRPPLQQRPSPGTMARMIATFRRSLDQKN
jgi:hypothetical protein